MYSLRLIYEGARSNDSRCNYEGRYVRINLKECLENNNSRNECPAFADGETRTNSNTSKLAGFLDVVLLLSASFYLKIILRRQKISNFITATAGILWSSRILMLLAIQHDIQHTHPQSESFSLLLEILNFAVLFFFFSLRLNNWKFVPCQSIWLSLVWSGMCHHLPKNSSVRFSKRHWCYVIKLMYWCYVSADFTLESGKKSGKKRCISFNNTYSLTVQGNNVSFVVSENTKDWLPLQSPAVGTWVSLL